MKKPEKKAINTFSKCAMGISGCSCNVKPKIYNQACDAWEKYHKEQQRINNQVLADKCDELDRFVMSLPSEEEIKDYIKSQICIMRIPIMEIEKWELLEKNLERVSEQAAQAISKRLRGE